MSVWTSQHWSVPLPIYSFIQQCFHPNSNVTDSQAFVVVFLVVNIPYFRTQIILNLADTPSSWLLCSVNSRLYLYIDVCH